jgi:CheY-like chemotaxis protein
MMPKFSGFQLLQVIRRNLMFKDLPVAIISAKSSEKDKQYAMRLGATAYQTKPMTPADMMKLVDSFIATPGFKVRPKTVAYKVLMQEEGDVHDIDAGEEGKFLKKTEGSSALQSFVDRYMKNADPEDETMHDE